MHPQFMNGLHQHIAEIAPIHGVKARKADDRTQWEIQFKPEATEQQKATAQAAMLAYEYQEPPAPIDNEKFAQLLIAKGVLSKKDVDDVRSNKK